MQNKLNSNISLQIAKYESLLQLEYQQEKASYELETKSVGIDRKVLQGKCWYPLLVGKAFFNALNNYVVELYRPASEEREHDFEPGRTVTFFRANSFEEPVFLPIVAQITFVQGNKVVVALPSPQALDLLSGSDRIGMQLYFDETSYHAMFDALKRVANSKDPHIDNLCQIIYGKRKPGFREIFPMRFPWLNPSQEQAVNLVLRAKDVAVIHGPPGTGKTTTLVEAIHETLHRESQVLVCAQSNTAVDWICEKLRERGVSLLRIGNPIRVNDSMLEQTYEHRFSSHPDYLELWSLRKAIRDTQSKMRKDSSRNDALRNHLSKLRNRATELEIKIENQLFGESRVIASTLIGASNKLLSHRKFTTLFIDEAAQALQPACWVAMQKADRVIFAGDHCQLPPTVKAYEALRKGLGHTLLEEIVEKYPESVKLLNMQYRMHESIMQFSSDWFYQGALKADAQIAHRSLSLLDYPMEWYDTQELSFHEQQQQHSVSKVNKPEAHALLNTLKAFITKISVERILDERVDMAIISPYKAQVYYLRSLVKRDKALKRVRHLIAINSVDGFQGQERDVVFISMVRGNEERKIGFLSDLRRMNVAITRARMKVVILGDAHTLTAHPFYHKLYKHIEQVGKVHIFQPKDESDSE